MAAAQAAMGMQSDANHPGKAVYDRVCAACHNNPEATRSPSLDTLKAMRYQTISYALTKGKMQAQAAALSAKERSDVIDFLVGRQATRDDWVTKAMCPASRGKIDLSAAPTVSGFGFDKQNHRHLSAAQAGLRTQDMRNLELAWAFAFPKATAMRSQPAIVGKTLFLPVPDSSRLFAIDIDGPPCVRWVYENQVPLRTSAGYGELPGSKRKVLVFGDLGANVHMVDAQTGKQIWVEAVGLHPLSLTTGTPVLHEDRVYVPISQYEISLGGNDDHECCKSHGAVKALDARTGKTIWTAHTMEDAKPVRDRGDGKMLWGPSGAPIWTSPAIDAKRGVLYVGTGEATSEPAAPTTDAVLAIDLKDGTIRWTFQATAEGHLPERLRAQSQRPQLPEGNRVPRRRLRRVHDHRAARRRQRHPDRRPEGRHGLGARSGQRRQAGLAAGLRRRLAPRRHSLGHRLRRRARVRADQSPVRLHAAEGRRHDAEAGHARSEGRHRRSAVDIRRAARLQRRSRDAREELRDQHRPVGCAGGDRRRGRGRQPRWVPARVRREDRRGAVQFDTARTFEAINGVEARGGSIDSASITAANGYLFVNSGYGMFGQLAGNVLLAFKVKGAP